METGANCATKRRARGRTQARSTFRQSIRAAEKPTALAWRGERKMKSAGKTTTVAFCGSCGAQLDESPSLPVEARLPCACGSSTRHFKCDIQAEKVQIRTAVLLKQKRPGKRGWLVEMFLEKQTRNAPGGIFIGWVDKYWRKDKLADRYTEHVVTEDGESLRDVDEPLSQGRGSDKPQSVLKAKGR